MSIVTATNRFFCLLPTNAVHSPLQATNAYLARFAHIGDIQRRIFAAMLANLDDSVGAILRKLQDKQLQRDTLVVFLSDNGGPTRELTSSNLPLRGEKGQMYEGGIRVPMMATWPGTLPSGRVFTYPVSSVDIYATSLAIAGAAVDSKSDGVNLLPYLQAENQTERPHNELYWRQGRKSAVRVGDWKLVRHGRSNPDDWELYDLSKDVAETLNLAPSRPQTKQRLERIWKRFQTKMVEPAFR